MAAAKMSNPPMHFRTALGIFWPILDDPVVIEDDGETTSERGTSSRATRVATGIDPYTSQAPTQGKVQRRTVAWVLLLPLNLLWNLSPSLFGVTSTSKSRWADCRRRWSCNTSDRRPLERYRGYSLILRPVDPAKFSIWWREGMGDREDHWQETDEESYEYKVRWKITWMLNSELRNVRRLNREFDAQVIVGKRAGRLG